MESLAHLCSAFGLSGAAGLNAYIPLLTVAIMQNRGAIHLAPPYDVMGQWWCIGLLIVLLIVEIVVDKVPGADHINDIIQTGIRPTAGAILFASQAGSISWVHPSVWIVIGLIMSGGVHTTKALARPVVNVGTVGTGAPIASLVEDLVSTVLSITAVLVPIFAVILLVIFGWILWRIFRWFFRGGKPVRAAHRTVSVRAVPVPAFQEQAPLPRRPDEAKWGGGV